MNITSTSNGEVIIVDNNAEIISVTSYSAKSNLIEFKLSDGEPATGTRAKSLGDVALGPCTAYSKENDQLFVGKDGNPVGNAFSWNVGRPQITVSKKNYFAK